jgi:Transcription factor zinc-finger
VNAIACPGCRQSMQPVALDRHMAGVVTVDLCGQCRALWFDAFESVQLSPAGTLQLFRAIHGETATAPVPLPQQLSCPRCTTSLDLTHDLQHTTRFTYYRCRNGHGRFTPFVQFLREKNFIRPVSPADLERLKKLVRIVRCSSCGAPIDLQTQTACNYCRAPIAILDPEAVARTLRELDAASAQRAAITSPDAAAAGILETARFEREMARQQARDDGIDGVDLVGIGLGMLASLAFH